MGLRKRIQGMVVEQAEPYLRKGEQIQAFFPVQDRSPLFWYARGRRNYMVLATDRRILLMSLDRWGGGLTGVEREIPRQTGLGPPHGLLTYKMRAFDRAVFVPRPWAELRRADAAISVSPGNRSQSAPRVGAENPIHRT